MSYSDGYLAGIIDGEGSIGLYNCKGRESNWRPLLTITNTSLEMIESMRDICGGGSIRCSSSIKDNEKPIYIYTMSSNLMRKILPNLTLIIKERQRELILEALEILGHIRNQYSKNYQERLRIEEIASELRVLNKRGKTVVAMKSSTT